MPFTDDFTESSDTALESHTPSGGTAWALSQGVAGGATVNAANDVLRTSTSGGVGVSIYHCDDQGNADHYTIHRAVTLGSANNSSFVACRLFDAGNFVGWRLVGTGSAGRRLTKSVGGTQTDLITSQGVANEWIKVEAEGSTIRFYQGGTGGSPSWTQIGSDASYSDDTTTTTQGVRTTDNATSVNWIDDFEAGALGGGGGGATTESIPNGALNLTGFAPTRRVKIREKIPSGSLNLSGIAPVFSIKSATINEQIPPGSLNLLSYPPTAWQKLRKKIPGSALNLSGISPNKLIIIRKRPPAGLLTLTGIAPNDRQKVREKIPAGQLTLTGIAPIARTGRVTKSIPAAYLKLTGYAPNIPRIQVVQKTTAGGKVRHRPQKQVIIGGRRYLITSYTELNRILNDYLKEKYLELQAIETKAPEKKKQIRLIRANITRTEHRIEKAKQKWIEQENEEILLLLVA